MWCCPPQHHVSFILCYTHSTCLSSSTSRHERGRLSGSYSTQAHFAISKKPTGTVVCITIQLVNHRAVIIYDYCFYFIFICHFLWWYRPYVYSIRDVEIRNNTCLFWHVLSCAENRPKVVHDCSIYCRAKPKGSICLLFTFKQFENIMYTTQNMAYNVPVLLFCHTLGNRWYSLFSKHLHWANPLRNHLFTGLKPCNKSVTTLFNKVISQHHWKKHALQHHFVFTYIIM